MHSLKVLLQVRLNLQSSTKGSNLYTKTSQGRQVRSQKLTTLQIANSSLHNFYFTQIYHIVTFRFRNCKKKTIFGRSFYESLRHLCIVHTSNSTFKLFSSCPNSKFNQICSTPINRLDSLADPKPSQTKTLNIWSIETTTKRSLSEQPRSCFFFLVVLRCIEWGRVKILKGYKCCIRGRG